MEAGTPSRELNREQTMNESFQVDALLSLPSTDSLRRMITRDKRRDDATQSDGRSSPTTQDGFPSASPKAQVWKTSKRPRSQPSPKSPRFPQVRHSVSNSSTLTSSRAMNGVKKMKKKKSLSSPSRARRLRESRTGGMHPTSSAFRQQLPHPLVWQAQQRALFGKRGTRRQIRQTQPHHISQDGTRPSSEEERVEETDKPVQVDTGHHASQQPGMVRKKVLASKSTGAFARRHSPSTLPNASRDSPPPRQKRSEEDVRLEEFKLSKAWTERKKRKVASKTFDVTEASTVIDLTGGSTSDDEVEVLDNAIVLPIVENRPPGDESKEPLPNGWQHSDGSRASPIVLPSHGYGFSSPFASALQQDTQEKQLYETTHSFEQEEARSAHNDTLLLSTKPRSEPTVASDENQSPLESSSKEGQKEKPSTDSQGWEPKSTSEQDSPAEARTTSHNPSSLSPASRPIPLPSTAHEELDKAEEVLDPKNLKLHLPESAVEQSSDTLFGTQLRPPNPGVCGPRYNFFDDDYLLKECLEEEEQPPPIPTLLEKTHSTALPFHSLLGNVKESHANPTKGKAQTTDLPIHSLLGNVVVSHGSTTKDDFFCNDFDPSCSEDTQSDGVLLRNEIELAWLVEESRYCQERSTCDWGFVWAYASGALRVKLRGGTELVRPGLAEAFRAKRHGILSAMQRGYRRPEMKAVIAGRRLLLKSKNPNATLTAMMQHVAQVRKPAAKKLPESAEEKPAAKKSRKSHAKKALESKLALPIVSQEPVLSPKLRCKHLTPYELEIAWLVEESIMQNVSDELDFDHMVSNASPSLRAQMEAMGRRRWLPRLVRQTNPQVKKEYEEIRAAICELLYSGYRRPETAEDLPTGYVTSSDYKAFKRHQAKL